MTIDTSNILSEKRIKAILTWHKNQELLQEYNKQTGQNKKIIEDEVCEYTGQICINCPKQLCAEEEKT